MWVSRSLNIALGAIVSLLALASPAFAQSGQNPKPPQGEDVVRVYSDLVQTDVMVFDKQGKFVNGLKREDFELRIDGKPRPVEFFEQITAGTGDEEVQLSAARGLPSSAKGPKAASAIPLDRGRTVFFYVDDFHLTPGSLVATRKLLSHFVDDDMRQNDEAAITSASGQIGFLQQVSDNKTVLRAAIGRITPRSYVVGDINRPPMSEYQALQIDRYDRDLTDYFVEALIRDGVPRNSAEVQVRARASQLLQQAAAITRNTLIGLESLVRSSSKLPGRKLVFFISDGFFLDERNSDTLDKLRRITSAAARNGVVIYSMDARGLVASLVDASSPGDFDPSGRVARSSSGELLASQDAMHALAADTGGRAIFNTNALDVGLAKALKETSVYYLLAWRTAHEAQASGKFRRISVSLIGHPDLSVRVRQGFFDVEPSASATQPKNKTPEAKTPEGSLREAFSATYPSSELPVAVSLGFLSTGEKKLMLTVTMQVNSESIVFGEEAGKQKGQIDLSGNVYNDQGKAGANFTDRVTITAASLEQLRQAKKEIIYTYQVYLPPGLYQVRVAVRDVASGKIGTAFEWIEVPDLSKAKLALSSLITGERLPEAVGTAGTTNKDESALGAAAVRVDHRFRRNSFLRFVVYVYNAALSPADSKPDIGVQTQILRDEQPVIITPSKRLPSEGIQQLDRLPYGADLSLEGLAAGRYVLRISVVDRVSKTTASQQMRFEIQ